MTVFALTKTVFNCGLRLTASRAYTAPREAQMNISAKYPWQQSYFDAACETDDSLMMGRVYEALSAIEERRLSPVEPGGDEERALTAADAAVQGLISERVEKPD
jgi:hypothetical protein